MRFARALVALLLVCAAPEALAQIRADAVLIVNSASPRYADAQRQVRPFLDGFGVPYTVLDIATTSVGPEVGDYAAIVIGHASLDTTGQYLDAAEQANLSNAVSQGSGLVNFDWDLTADGTNARYQFVRDVFGFGFRAATSDGEGVLFTSDAPGHYVSERHAAGQVIATRQMPAAAVVAPAGAAVLARFQDSGNPFLVTTAYGQGRAVQWTGYDWMTRAGDILRGPLRGLDDLVWRGVVWAARKPFVMQGLPNFVTMRVDDVSGPLWWVRTANEFQLKPFLALFYKNVSETDAADLASLTNAGGATASVHSTGGEFFYYDHFGRQNLPDATMASNFADATAWHQAHGIPISSYVVPHFYEIGSNVFAGLDAWGVRSIATHMAPGQPYGSPWLMLGPYRLFDAGASDDAAPVVYADYVSIPGHPEYANRFFDCLTEIRDDAGYEWYPDATDVAGTIGRGTRQVARALDAMAVATLFTHEHFIQAFTSTDWRAALTGIMNGVASYDPTFVTMDYACEYLRAKHDSRITSSVYDPATRILTTDLSGRADLVTQFLVFTEAGEFVLSGPSGVPAFNGVTRVAQQLAPGTVPSLVSIAVMPATPTVVIGATQQFAATGTYSDGTIRNLTNQVVWATSAGAVATISAAGVATGVAPGSAIITATSSGGVSGTTTLTVRTAPLAISTASLPSGMISAPYGAALVATGGAPPYYWSLSSGALPPGLLLSAGGDISGTPSTLGTFPFTVAVTDAAASSIASGLSIAVVSSSGISIWPATAVPGTVDAGPDNAVELGVKFRSDVSGAVTGIRFYKSIANTGVHIGNLWAGNGTLLASATFTGESASGWQQMTFPAPVTIVANTTYVASYHASAGHYARDRDYFATAGFDRPPLHAPSSSSSGGNGVFAYGASSAFPSDSVVGTNYWVDVVFSAGAAPTLSSIAVTPANPSIATGATLQLGATGTYSDGSTLDLTSQATWSSSSGAVATLSASGVATGVGAGTATVSAASAGISGSTQITVTPVVASIVVTPSAVRLASGATQQFSATAYDAQNGPMPGAPISWSTTGGGTVTAGGLFTAGSTPGAFADNVVASSGAIAGAASTEIVALSAVTLAPAGVVEGDGSTGTVTLSGPAPDGGTTVSLSSNAAAATVPASVAVTAGATSATFAVATSAVTATANATITASVGGVSRTAALSIAAATVAIAPTSVPGGTSATGTVTLSAARTSDVTLALSSSNAAAAVPATVTIPAGSTAASFAVTTAPVAASTAVTLSATKGTVSSTATLTVTAAVLSAVALSPSAVVEGDPSTGTVSLSGPAPAGGATVTLSSNNAAATVPASVTIPGGAQSAPFPIATSGVSGATNVTLSASYAGATRTATLAIRALTVTLSPTTVGGGNGSTATLRLSASVGVPVTAALSTSNAAVATVPPTVTLAAGATTATFPVSTSTVTGTTPVQIIASYAGISTSANLSVRVISPSALSLAPTSVVGATSSTGTVTLNYPAPAAGYVVTLASSRTTAATVPASVTVPAGARTATFPVTTFAVAANTSSSISARGGGVTRSATLTVTAPVAQSLTLSPATVQSNATSTGTVTLNGIAPSGGRSVTLTSSNTAVATVPASVVVPAGVATATFNVTARAVTVSTAVTLSAAAGGSTATATLTVNP